MRAKINLLFFSEKKSSFKMFISKIETVKLQAFCLNNDCVNF